MATEEKIYLEIKKAIIQQKLRPNTQLIEAEISESFGVSRTPVRNVLRRLAHEKLVRIIPNKGTYIASPTIEEVKEVFDMREILETAAVRKLCSGISEKQYKELKILIDEENEARDQGRLNDVLQITCDFHLKVAEFAGNSFSYRYIEELVSLNYVIMALYGQKHLHVCGHAEHAAILNAIDQEDEQAAERLMIEHLREIVHSLNLDENLNQSISMKDIFNSSEHSLS